MAILRVVEEIIEFKNQEHWRKRTYLDKDGYYNSHDSSFQLLCMYNSAIAAFTIVQ